MRPSAEGRAVRAAALPLGTAAAAALALVGLGQTAWAPLLHHGPDAGGHHAAHVAPGVASAAWLVGWGLMVAAMMLPGAVPLVREVGVLPRARGGGRERAFAVAGFLGAWGALGCAVLASTAPARALAPGLILVAAGLYQLTPAKRRALARCRSHARLLPPGGATGRDPSGDALRAGVTHGLASVACCGPLMAALALTGMAAPALMLVAGVAMTVEVAAPRGPRITVPIGAALLGAGLLALLA
jgi:predicted metal-binding membrane protein